MLFEKTRTNPPYLAEIPYGFKNLWLVTVSAYDVQAQTFSATDVVSVVMNGCTVTADQMRMLFDYNRDGCSLKLSDATRPGGLFVTITHYDAKARMFSFQTLIEQDLTVATNGILSLNGDMVNNDDPLNPVIDHDDQKLDTDAYFEDQSDTNDRLSKAEAGIESIEKQTDALDQGKQDKLSGAPGQIVGFNSAWAPMAQDAPDTGVISFNGRTDVVMPADGDYTADMGGAIPSPQHPTANQVLVYDGERWYGADLSDIGGEAFTELAEQAAASAESAEQSAQKAEAALDSVTERLGNAEAGVRSAIKDAKDAKDSLEIATATANTAQSDLDTSTQTANTAKENLHTVIQAGHETQHALDTSNASAETTKVALDASISVGESLLKDLSNTNSEANSTKEALDNSITVGSNTKDALDTIVSFSNTTKDALESASKNAVAAQGALETATSAANTARTALLQPTEDAQTVKSALDSSISASRTIKEQLDDSNITAQATKSDLEISTTIGNSTKAALDDSISTGGTTRDGLEAAVLTANTAAGDLNIATQTANTAAASLEQHTEDANTAKADLETATSAANNAKDALKTPTEDARKAKTELDAANAHADKTLASMWAKVNFILGPDEPEGGPCLWFNTSGHTEADTEVVRLTLDPDGAEEVMANVEGKTHAVKNAGVNITPTQDQYSLNII